MHRRQPRHGRVSGRARGGREPRRQRGLDAAARHLQLRLPLHRQIPGGEGRERRRRQQRRRARDRHRRG